MRYGLFLLAVAAGAQQPEAKGFVNQGLFRRHIFEKATAKKAPDPVQLYVPACAIPLLQAQVAKDVDKAMVMPGWPDKSGDPKMILPTVPVCPSR